MDSTAYSTTNTKNHNPSPPSNNSAQRTRLETVNEDTSAVARHLFYVRLKGLPWGTSKQQIIEFFQEICEIPREDINILISGGRASGEALVGLANEGDWTHALQNLNEKYIESRYIEVQRSSPVEWNRIASRVDKKHNVPISQTSLIILMRGLPFTAHEDDCLEFFKPIHCLGFHLTKEAQTGRPSGQGYAEFENKANFDAALKLHKKNMQDRYIELFESTIDELVENVTGKYPHVDNYDEPSPRIEFSKMHSSGYTTSVPNPTGAPPICIKMRGLPYDTTESEITKFFQRERITPSRIHRKQNGGEAFVEFANPAFGTLAMKLNRAFMGKRYVELFKVEYDEMSRLVGLPSHNSQPPKHQNFGSSPPNGGHYGRQGGNNYNNNNNNGGSYNQQSFRGNSHQQRFSPYGGGRGRGSRGRGRGRW